MKSTVWRNWSAILYINEEDNVLVRPTSTHLKPTTLILTRRLHFQAYGIWDLTTRTPRQDGKLMGDKEAFDRPNMALLGLHAWVYKETSCAPRLTLIKRIPTRKGSCEMRALMRIFPTRKDPFRQGTDVNSTLLWKPQNPHKSRYA